MSRLAGKAVIICGAGSIGPGWGNGKAIAVLFAREGARVVAIDRDADAAEETRALIEAEGGACVVQRADVTREADVEALTARAVEAFGRIDVLVNNVGGGAKGGPVETTLESWHSDLDLNLTSAFLTCRHVIPHLARAGGGAIVNISSIASIRWGGLPYVGYAAAKAGLNQLTRVVAAQHAHEKVRCNAVLPGLIATPFAMRAPSMVAKAAAGADPGKRVPSSFVPLGHLGDAWDIAEAALFLASDEARFITGAELVVDGGVSATLVGRLAA